MQTPKDIDALVSNGAVTTATVGPQGVGFSGGTKTGGTPAIAPASNAASGTAVNGPSIDRLVAAGDFSSCSLFAESGVSTNSGGGATQSAAFKIQDSADGVTFADYVPPGLAVAPTLVLNGDSQAAQMGIDLSGARQFVRVTYTPTYVTITAQLYAAQLVLGGAQVQPTAFN